MILILISLKVHSTNKIIKSIQSKRHSTIPVLDEQAVSLFINRSDMVFDNLDYYKILEVSPKALKNIIQNAYRTLAKNTPLIKDLQLK